MMVPRHRELDVLQCDVDPLVHTMNRVDVLRPLDRGHEGLNVIRDREARAAVDAAAEHRNGIWRVRSALHIEVKLDEKWNGVHLVVVVCLDPLPIDLLIAEQVHFSGRE